MAHVTTGWLKFDGTDDYVTCNDDATYDVSTNLSMYLRFIRDYADDQSCLVARVGTIKVEITVDDFLKVTVYGVTAVKFKLALAPQEIHDIGLVIHEEGSDLYFDLYYKGVLYEQTYVETAAMPAATNTAYLLGYNATAQFFNGRMANFILTSDELTAAEMLSIYQHAAVNVQDVALFNNHILAIPFDEGTGTSLDDDGDNNVTCAASGTPVWPLGPGLHLGANPMIAKAQNDQFYGMVLVQTIEWYAPTTTTHLVEVTDWNGNAIFRDKCAVAHTGNGQKLVNRIVDGIKVSDLDSGQVIITYDGARS